MNGGGLYRLPSALDGSKRGLDVCGGLQFKVGRSLALRMFYLSCSCIDFDKILARVNTIQTKLNDR